MLGQTLGTQGLATDGRYLYFRWEEELGDIWVMDKTGGTATQVTHSPGEESWPRFSPDGSEIAYTASYNGNQDVYVMPASGRPPYPGDLSVS